MARYCLPSTENVIGAEIRPIHARVGLRQDLASSLLKGRALLGIVLGPRVPPVPLNPLEDDR